MDRSTEIGRLCSCFASAVRSDADDRGADSTGTAAAAAAAAAGAGAEARGTGEGDLERATGSLLHAVHARWRGRWRMKPSNHCIEMCSATVWSTSQSLIVRTAFEEYRFAHGVVAFMVLPHVSVTLLSCLKEHDGSIATVHSPAISVPRHRPGPLKMAERRGFLET